LATYGVVGAGTMGSGIAFLMASRLDAPVILQDVSAEALEAARGRMQRWAEHARGRGTPEEEAGRWSSRIRFTERLADLEPAEVVVEAVFEDLELKSQVFRELDGLVRPEALLASNTSGLSITRIAAATRHPARVIGTHFFNPVHAMRLVEVVIGPETAPETLERARRLCADLGKETITVRDHAGFVVTRVGQAMICEAIRCLEQGIASPEDIDRGLRLGYNYPLGPLELVDLIGVDTELRVLESLHAELGEAFRPSPLLRSMVAAGHLGRKTGRGFFSYPQEGVRA
jgi:3-hydroxybutyryl-CoA dehydrogenase